MRLLEKGPLLIGASRRSKVSEENCSVNRSSEKNSQSRREG